MKRDYFSSFFATNKKQDLEKGFSQKFEKIRPTSIDEEVKWDKTKTIISTTNKEGTIIFANDVFCDVCGYSKEELEGQPHNIIRHPDMPRAIFKVLWDHILDGHNFHAIVKNLAKSGRYYWVITNFSMSRDGNGNIKSFLARRNSIPTMVVDKYIAPLYKNLLEIEKVSGMEASLRYITHFLKEKETTYPKLIHNIMKECGGNMDLLSDFVTYGKNPFIIED